MLLLLCTLLFAAPASTHPAHSVARPRLAVVMVIDQFSAQLLTRLRPHLATGGFTRFLDEGAFYADARYRYLDTATAPGHAVVSTGAYPNDTGIVDNIIWDRTHEQPISILHDDAHPALGRNKVETLEDTSPRTLLVDTLGDELGLASAGRSKVVTIAYKSRSAILLAGHAGGAYWISDRGGALTTSTWYRAKLPAWAEAFNAKKVADTFHGKKWTAQLHEAEYASATDDDAAWEDGAHGLGVKFPHPVAGDGEAFYTALFATPLGSDVLLSAALAAVAGESLGQDEFPDLLGVSLTANDYVGHHFGYHSREAEEALLDTDRQLAAFFAQLDKMIGRDRYVAVLTGDHGAAPIPEYAEARHLDAGRVTTKAITATITAALNAKYGTGAWIDGAEYPSVYLSHQLIEQHGLALDDVERVAAKAALTLHGLARAVAEGDLETAPDLFLSSYPGRSGDVLIAPAPFWIWGYWADLGKGTTHDSGYAYDNHVPLGLWGPAFVRAGRHTDRVDPAQVAPTLAEILGIEAPAAARGGILPGALKTAP